MTIQEKYLLSCYEEVSKLKEHKQVYLVRNVEDEHLYIKKVMNIYNKSVYLKLQNLHIPNIPTVHHCIESNDKLIVIEDYIHGRSLQEIYQKEGTFSETNVISIMRDLCRILIPLHQCQPPIIHRDIKPSNIMISNDGIVKLIDFNAAKQYISGKSEDTYLMGTQEFAAPEQYGFGQSDARTDIYAMGVLMNYLLIGEYPKKQIAKGVLENIIKQCISLDADQRFQSVSALDKALSYIQQTQLTKEKVPLSANYKKPIQKNANITNKKMQKEKKKDTCLYKENPYLPIGFRTGYIPNMIIAIIGYLFLFSCCAALTTTNEQGENLQGIPLLANRIGSFFLFMGYIYFIGNYANIRYRLPGMNQGKLKHFICGTLYLMAFSIIVVLIITMFE